MLESVANWIEEKQVIDLVRISKSSGPSLKQMRQAQLFGTNCSQNVPRHSQLCNHSMQGQDFTHNQSPGKL